MSSIALRLAKLERPLARQGKDYWLPNLELLSDEQLDRFEALYLKICDRPDKPSDEMLWSEAMALLSIEDQQEMLSLLDTMGMEREDLDL